MPSGARTTYCSNARGGGPHIAELAVQHAGLAPQIGEIGSQHQHRLDDFDRPLVALLLHQPRFEVVLQAQQHIAVRDRRVIFRRQLAVAADDRLQQLAQFGRAADLAAVERIEDQPLRPVGQPDQKMAGKGEPGRLPALRAGGVDEQDPEHHRQPFAAVDDPHQIGVLQIVVGQLVAGIAVLQQDDLVERAGAVGKIARRAGMARDIAGDQPQMIAVAGEIDALALERGQHQRRLGDRQDRARPRRRARAESARNSRDRDVQAARSYCGSLIVEGAIGTEQYFSDR